MVTEEGVLKHKKYKSKLERECASCGEIVPHWKTFTPSNNNHNRPICVTCCFKSYTYCTHCHRFFHGDCSCRRRQRDDGLTEWNHLMLPSLLANDDGPYLGVEIEFFNLRRKNVGTQVKKVLEASSAFLPKFDGSIRGRNGIELASHIISEKWIKDNKDQVESVLGLMSGNGFVSCFDESCSTHIHYFDKELSNDIVKNILTFGAKEEELLRLLSNRRRKNQFWGIPKSSASIESISKTLTMQRNTWLNTTPENTIEFRLFGGTGSYHGLMYYIDVVSFIVALATRLPTEAIREKEEIKSFIESTKKEFPFVHSRVKKAGGVDSVRNNLQAG